jgi:O-antigen ligase
VGPVQQKTNRAVVGAAFPILLICLFLIFSALFEFIPGARNLRPVLVLATIGLLILFTSGQAIKVVATPVGKILLIFTGWFLVCIPLAIWRGGSFEIFIEDWYKTVLMFVLTAGLLSTVPQAKKLFHAIAYAIALTAMLALTKGAYLEGRLTLPGTRYGNSNDLGLTLLVGLTFLAYSFKRGKQRERAVAVVLSLPVLLALVKTGSRAAMLGVVMLFVLGFLGSAKNRLKLMVSTPLILIALAVVVPSNLRQRYFTWFKSTDPTEMTGEEKRAYLEATGSSEARIRLLKDSLIITFQHPLFGVGPGNYMVEQNNLAIARGELGLWHVPHNTYTEVSSEMGIPGLILYVIFLYQTFKLVTSIARSQEQGEVWPDLRALAESLRSALVVLMTIAFFDSFAYVPEVPIIAGLAVGLAFIAQERRSADGAPTAVARAGNRARVLISNRYLGPRGQMT